MTPILNQPVEYSITILLKVLISKLLKNLNIEITNGSQIYVLTFNCLEIKCKNPYYRATLQEDSVTKHFSIHDYLKILYYLGADFTVSLW